ncbi:aldo/keto reductase [Catenuloplanes atrovinosus]|uniref:Aryl-alcohol dehydrogenase-like predicted oxidoreductase n=1 Tax=Catenuloplanes atrovinosus TaxID=137266 RepID=A0AAE4CGI3_9ACTN|nr:aldo/keto reductase [Catenuloplanes atrovinosus]MDR7280725.1 aryl-alcohol dehydrogenase-like predicted oxidoreductase [Catenuloplanes atrovinosus]
MTDLRAALPVRERGGYRQSALVLGGAQLGGAYGIANTTGGPTDAVAAELLVAAAGLGVTHVDTARAYGESERRIGAAASGLRTITKVAPLGAVASCESSLANAVAASVARSAEHLGEPLTILLHRAADALAVGGAAWHTLRRYAERGLAERVGVSVQSPAELRAVLRLPGLGYVQLPCNVLDRRWLAADLADTLAQRPDLVVTVRSVYLQGLLAAGRMVRWPHLDPGARNTVVDTLDRLAPELGRADRADLCLAYVLGLPWVTSVVVGADSVAQLRANVALASRTPLTADERAHVLAALPHVPLELLDPSRWTP